MKSNNFDRSKCEKYEEMLSFYIDNELSEADKAALETHLSSCADCRAAHEDLREMLGALNGLEELDLPEGFHENFMEKLAAETASERAKKPLYMRARAYAQIAAGFVVLFLLLTGALRLAVGPGYETRGTAKVDEYTGSSARAPAAGAVPEIAVEPESAAESLPVQSADAYDAPLEKDMRGALPAVAAPDFADNGEEIFFAQQADIEESLTAVGEGITSAGTVVPYGDLHIKNYTLTVTTAQYDAAIQALDQYSGYILSNSSSQYGDYKTMGVTFKVPERAYQSVIEQLRALGKIDNEFQDERVITYDLMAAVSGLEAREKEYANLLSLVAKTETIEDMLAVDNRLSEVGSEVETLKTTLRNWQSEKEQPLITLTINEQPADQPQTAARPLSERISASFIGSANGATVLFELIVLGLSNLFVPLLLIAVCAGIVLFLRRKGRKG